MEKRASLQTGQDGNQGEIVQLYQKLSEDRRMQVKLHGDTSVVFPTENGIPQGSILSPTLFNIYTSDLSDILANLGIQHAMYADDLTLWYNSPNLAHAARKVQTALDKIGNWSDIWGLQFTPTKSKAIIFTTRRPNSVPKVYFQHTAIKQVKYHTLLGLHLDSRLTWKIYVQQLKITTARRMNIINYLSGKDWGGDRATLLSIYKMWIRPKIEYGAPLFTTAASTTLRQLDTIQNTCVRASIGALRCTKTLRLNLEAGVPSLQDRRAYLL